MCWLAECELDSIASLRAVGPVVAFLSVKQRHADASLNLLWAIYGAIHDVDWRDVSETAKAELRNELRAELDSHLT